MVALYRSYHPGCPPFGKLKNNPLRLRIPCRKQGVCVGGLYLYDYYKRLINECEIEICEENERIIRWIGKQKFPEKSPEKKQTAGKIQRKRSRLRGRKPSGRSRRVHFPGDYPNDISISISVFYFPIGIPAESFSRSSSVRESKKASTLPEHISISGFTEMKVQT